MILHIVHGMWGRFSLLYRMAIYSQVWGKGPLLTCLMCIHGMCQGCATSIFTPPCFMWAKSMLDVVQQHHLVTSPWWSRGWILGGGNQRIAGMISYLHMHCMKQSFLVPHISFKGIIYRGLIFVQEANKRHYDFWASVVLSFVFSPDLWGSLTPFPQNKNKKQSSGGWLCVKGWSCCWGRRRTSHGVFHCLPATGGDWCLPRG